ncbi:MAG: hypothetical protein JXR77_12250 [Lentisphaeria bacterium]|nr:hypothetical protein [Lentisphaeria bacterium]
MGRIAAWRWTVGLVLLLAACRLGAAAPREKEGEEPAKPGGKAVAREREAGPKDAREGVRQAPPEKKKRPLLTAETIARSKEQFPQILDLRQTVDTLYEEYEKRALMLGRKERKDALRELPAIAKDLAKGLEKLEELHAKTMKPLKETREDLEREEARLMERIGRIEDRNREAGAERKAVDELVAKQGELDDRMALLDELGSPGLVLEDPEEMVLGSLLRPSEQQARSLRHVVGEYPDLVEGRLYLAHLQAEMEAARRSREEDGDGGDAREQQARLERQREQVLRKFRGVFLDVRREYIEALEDAQEERDRIAPRADRERERGKPGKYEQMLSSIESRLEGCRRNLQAVDLFVKGTGAVEKAELDAMLPENRHPDR